MARAATFSIEGELRAALDAVQNDDMAAVATHAKAARDVACALLMNAGKPNPVDGNGYWVCDVTE